MTQNSRFAVVIVAVESSAASAASAAAVHNSDYLPCRMREKSVTQEVAITMAQITVTTQLNTLPYWYTLVHATLPNKKCL